MTEEVANEACTNAYEHLDEVRTAHREERYTSLASNSLRQQRLTCSRRAYEQCTLRNLSSEVSVFLRFLKEVYNLLHLLLGSSLSGYVLERNAKVVALLIHLSL